MENGTSIFGARPPGRAHREAREELHERRVLEVRVVRARDRVLRRGQRVERLVHRRAVEAGVVEDERRRRTRRERARRARNLTAATLGPPRDCRGSERPTPATLAPVSARSGGLSRDGRFVLLVFLAALALRLAPFPDATAQGAGGSSRPTATATSGAPSRSPATSRASRIHDRVPEPSGRRRLHLAARRSISSRAAFRARSTGARPRPKQVVRVAALLPALLGALHVLPLFAVARRILGRPPRADRDRRLRRDPRRRPLGRLRPLRPPRGRGAQPAPRPRGRRVGRRRARGASDSRAPPSSGPRSPSPSSRGRAPCSWPASRSCGRPRARRGRGRGRRSSRRRSSLSARRRRLPAEPVPFSFVSFGWFQPLLLAGATVPLLALAAWRAPNATATGPLGTPHGRRPRPWPCRTRGRVLAAVFHGGAYVFKEGAGESGERLRGRRLPLLPAGVPASRRRVPASRPRVEVVRARGPRALAGLPPRARSRRSSGRRPASAGRAGLGPRPPPPRALRGGRVRDGPLPAAQRLLPRDLRRARARRGVRARIAPRARSFAGTALPFLLAAGLVIVPGWPVPPAGPRLRGRARVRRPRPLREAPRARSASGGSRGHPAAGAGRDSRRDAAVVRGALRDGARGAAGRRGPVRLRLAPAVPAVHGDGRRRGARDSDGARSAGISSRRTSRRSSPPTRPPRAARPRPRAGCSRGGCTSRTPRRPFPFLERVLDSRTGTRRADGTLPAAIPRLSRARARAHPRIDGDADPGKAGRGRDARLQRRENAGQDVARDPEGLGRRHHPRGRRLDGPHGRGRARASRESTS